MGVASGSAPEIGRVRPPAAFAEARATPGAPKSDEVAQQQDRGGREAGAAEEGQLQQPRLDGGHVDGVRSLSE